MAGSALKTPAVTSPTPYTVNRTGPAIAPRPARRCGTTPYPKLRLSTPATMKLALCTHPYSPLASRLIGWRVRSKPSRVNIWTTAVVTNRGPARAPANRGPRRWTPEAEAVVMVLACEARTVMAVFLSEAVCALTPASTDGCDSRHKKRKKFPAADVENFTFGTTRAVRGRSAPTRPTLRVRSTP